MPSCQHSSYSVNSVVNFCKPAALVLKSSHTASIGQSNIVLKDVIVWAVLTCKKKKYQHLSMTVL